jgi:hypothetical protein
MVAHHDVFQGYVFLHFPGHVREARERFRGHPHFERPADFARLYDQSAFDPDYPTMPLEAFAPILRRVLARQRNPAWPARRPVPERRAPHAGGGNWRFAKVRRPVRP